MKARCGSTVMMSVRGWFNCHLYSYSRYVNCMYKFGWSRLWLQALPVHNLHTAEIDDYKTGAKAISAILNPFIYIHLQWTSEISLPRDRLISFHRLWRSAMMPVYFNFTLIQFAKHCTASEPGEKENLQILLPKFRRCCCICVHLLSVSK